MIVCGLFVACHRAPPNRAITQGEQYALAPLLLSPSKPRTPSDASAPLPETGDDAHHRQDASTALSLPVQIEFEKPYPHGARPRRRGAVLAAAQDEELGRWNLGGNSHPSYASNRPGFHPGTRVRVDTLKPSRQLPKRAKQNRRTGRYAHQLSRTSLLARSRRLGYWPFRICFEEAKKKDRKLLGGKTKLLIRLTSRGRVRRARLLSSDFKDNALTQCLATAAKAKLRYPPPRGPLSYQLAISLWPGDVPLPETVNPEAQPAHKILDRKHAQNILGTARDSIRSCYESGVAKDPELWGRVGALLQLDRAGNVTASRQHESQFPDPTVADCVTAALAELQFAPPKPGGEKLVAGIRLGTPPWLRAKPEEADAQTTEAQTTKEGGQ